MPDTPENGWLAPIEREAAVLIVDLLRLRVLGDATLSRDTETGALRLRYSDADGAQHEGLLAFSELPLPD